MKSNMIKQCLAALALGLAFSLTSSARADSSSMWESIGAHQPAAAATTSQNAAGGSSVQAPCPECFHGQSNV
jgi:hypothetical protein